MRVLITVAGIALLAACSSGTRINVSDADARIYVNGEYIGTGNAYYHDRRPSFTKQDVTLRKEGCAAQSYVMRRSERPDLGAIVSAYYLAVPILWVAQYKDHHTYEFDCPQAPAD